MFLLPSTNAATKKILEGSTRCDIYTPLSPSEQSQLMDGFLRFIEGWLNKIRRPVPNKNWVTIINYKKKNFNLQTLEITTTIYDFIISMQLLIEFFSQI